MTIKNKFYLGPIILFALICTFIPTSAQDEQPIIIAHRGASGYLPEHTLEAKVMAYAMGADYIEQDVVLTKDGVPIVIHDIHLEAVTDVAEVFPDRARPDGRYYAIDFDLAEIKQLKVTERIDPTTGEPVFSGRFPLENVVGFEIPTLAEEIVVIQGLNKSTGREVGIYPELKSPQFHLDEGQDIGAVVLALLRDYGYTAREDKVYVQCFDADYTRYLREKLGSDLKLVQLIGARDAQMASARGLDQIAEYADGIGPRMNWVATFNSAGEPMFTGLVEEAHARGLVVHPYTFRADALPDHVENIDRLFEIFFIGAGVDGVFTDQPDKAAAFWREMAG